MTFKQLYYSKKDNVKYNQPLMVINMATPPDCPITHGFEKETCEHDEYDPEKCAACWERQAFKVGDKVRILDGRKIPEYEASFISEMEEFVGKIYTVREASNFAGIWLEDSNGFNLGYTWDQRGLEKL